MNIRRNTLPRQGFSEFVEQHNLTLVLAEKNKGGWSAHLEGVEIQDGCLLGSCYGHGHTVRDAVLGLAHAASLQRLVVDAYKSSRREIMAPLLHLDAKAENELTASAARP